MPTEGAVLGFSSQWYRDGMAKAEQVMLPNGERVFVFSFPYLLASKLEAFRERGKQDFQASKDLEDVVALLDGRPEAEEKLNAAPADVRHYVGKELARLLADEQFLLSLEGHLGAGAPVAEGGRRVRRFLALVRRVAGPAAAP